MSDMLIIVKTGKRNSTKLEIANVFILMGRVFLDAILVMKATYANHVS